MNQHLLPGFVGILLLGSLTSCSGDGDSSSTAPAQHPSTSSSAVAERHQLLVLGDSIPAGDPGLCDGCTPFAMPYADALQATLKGPVTVVNDAVNDTASADLLTTVSSDQKVRDDVSASDVIVVMIGHNDTPWVSDTDPCDGSASQDHANWDRYDSACTRSAASTMSSNLTGILHEIDALRGSRPTLLRVLTFYNDNEKDPLADPGGDEASKAAVDAFSRAICDTAAEDDLGCVDVYHAFNGPDGTLFDGDLVASDHVHPSTAGHQVIAQLLLDSGFAPLT